MPLTPRHRQELLGILALAAGVFLGLAMLPVDLTGPLGRSAGRGLWNYFGLGAAMLPVLGLGVGLAAFGRFTAVTPKRLTVLFTGLAILVPFAVAIGAGIHHSADVPADIETGTALQRLAGIVPSMLVVGLNAVVGSAGATLVGLLALSGVTIVTLDWHPFRRLAAERAAPRGKKGAIAADVDDDVVIAPVKKKKDKTKLEESKAEEPTAEEPMAEKRGEGKLPKPKKEKKASGTHLALVKDEELPVPEQGRLVPPIDLLDQPPAETSAGGEQEFERLATVLVETLSTFKVGGKVVDRTTGPVVTRFEVAPDPGVKVGRIAALADDLALTMRAKSIRIVAPIPGKAAVGVEVPNPKSRMVTLRALFETETWQGGGLSLPVALGLDIEGQPIIADLAKMPHLLIAGATGSGKSVCINTLITSLCYAHPPEELRFLMIDPKMVELSVYQNLPHLRHPVVTNNHNAATIFKWAVREMERRYQLLSANKARNLVDFNSKVKGGKELIDPAGKPTLASQVAEEAGQLELPTKPAVYGEGILPYVVLVVDELADLMMTVQGEVEKPLAILAQKARAVGIHIVLATQRPSVNVITGLIKANFPCRVAFRVSAKVDSRTILDQNGAEALLGNGDMLFLPPGKSESIRIQGAYINTDETERLMEWYKAHPWKPHAEIDILEQMAALDAAAAAAEGKEGGETAAGDRDARFREAAELCIQNQLGSTSLLQRRMSIGYGRAARIIDQLHDAGILGPPDGSKPREVLIGMDQVDEYCS
jgi:S-DNA-T family DNA segregation ATPase FtsK/SpoIIIE